MRFFQQALIGISAIALLIPSAIFAAVAKDNVSEIEPGLPGRRISGGSRGECLSSAQPLVALNPATNLGITASSQPSLHFVVSTFSEPYTTKFSLRDDAGNRVYEEAIALEKDQEILSVQIPENSLQAEQNYRWRFAVVCDPEDSAQNIVLTGWLQQSSQAFATQDDLTADAVARRSLEENLELVRTYQEAELWSDAVSSLVMLRQQYPEDRLVKAEWANLLRSLNLQNVIEPAIAAR